MNGNLTRLLQAGIAHSSIRKILIPFNCLLIIDKKENCRIIMKLLNFIYF